MKVPKSPLQLEAFLVHSLSLCTNPEYRPEAAESGRISVDPELLQHRTEPHKHALRLTIRYRPDAKQPEGAPYDISIDGMGFFSVAENVPTDEEMKLVVYNGSAILYGLLRGQIAQATALAQYGPLLLPTVNLVPALNQYIQRALSKLAEKEGSAQDESSEAQGEEEN